MDKMFLEVNDEQPLNSAFHVYEFEGGPTHAYGHSHGRTLADFLESTSLMLAQCDRYARVIERIEISQFQDGEWVQKDFTRAEVEQFIKQSTAATKEAYEEMVTKLMDTLVLCIDDLKRITKTNADPELPKAVVLLEIAEDIMIRTIGGGYDDDDATFEPVARKVRH